MSKVRVGIVGVGNMGTAHANSINSCKIEGMELSALCDQAPKRIEYCLKKFPKIPVFDNWKEMINSNLLDAVIIATPHNKHCEIAEYALKRNLHVMVEKPIDITVSAAKKLNNIAEKTNKVFSIMFNQRTNEVYSKAREIIKSGALGEIKRTVWIITNWYRTQQYYDSGEWRASWAGEGGGVLLNQAPHNLDLWQWICGMPQEITAFCDFHKYHEIEVEDDVTIFARYKNGATGTFITSTGEYPGTNRLEISGDYGKIVVEGGKLKFWKLNMSEREYCFNSDNPNYELEVSYSEFESNQPETAHVGILQNFTNAILDGEELLSPGIDGINELTISNAAYLSAFKGSVPVKLPFDENEFDEMLSEHIRHSVFKNETGSKHENGTYFPRWFVQW